jgi:hypothetical protein
MQGLMRGFALPAAAAALVLLTGAGQASDGFTVTDASAQQVADAYSRAKPGGPMHMGQWDRSIEIATFELPGLPAGTYVVKAWHPDFGELSRTVKVPASGAAAVDFEY